jgi:hypothetical protein
MEINITSPDPEETITVTTIARKCATVTIPISNPKQSSAEFSVVLSDDILFGASHFTVRPCGTENYVLIVSPLKATKQTARVVFVSEDDGEFWYSLQIDATEAPPNTLAPLSSPLGQYATTYVNIENPTDKVVTFRIENDNQTAFHVVAKRVLQLAPRDKRRVEVRYIPTSVGVKETAKLVFRSPEVGDWVFVVSGTGRPPPPLAPVSVFSQIDVTNSALVIFANPFPYPARFSLSLNSDSQCLTLLTKRRLFTLASFGDEFQVPFSFTPVAVGQWTGTIVVAYLGPTRDPPESLPTINWLFPIVGSCVAAGTVETKTVKCRANETFLGQFTFSLVGEQEPLEPADYSVTLAMPTGYEFLDLLIRPVALRRLNATTELSVEATFSPSRPVNITAKATVSGSAGQQWHFNVAIVVEPGRPIATLVVESLLGKTGTLQVAIPNVIRGQVAFHAYFVQGSAQEFRVEPEHGFVEPGLGEEPVVLPAVVVFAPKMYGKVLRGMLVVDTVENQWLFEVCGKTPDYVPPVVAPGGAAARLENQLSPDQAEKMQNKRKRNVIKENIDSAKIARPTLSPHPPRK